MKTRIILTTAIAALVAPAAQAQITLSTGSGSYTQNFDSLISTGLATWNDNSTIAGWYAQRTGTGTGIQADPGSVTAGNLYSYGSTSASDRALGSLGSGSAGNFAWGVSFQNTSGLNLSLDSLSYVGEQWRNSAAPAQTVSFWYQISATPITALTPGADTGWTALTALDFTSPITGGTAGALNGNLPANKVAKSSSIALALSAGQYIMFRWRDIDHPGVDHGLSIDDFSLTWSSSAPTLYWDTNGATAGIGGTGTWDTVASNWSTVATGDVAPQAYNTASPTVFGGTAGTVTIDAGGVTSSGGIQFETSNYTVTGGTLTLGSTSTITSTTGTTGVTISAPIAGSNGLVKAGAGELTLSPSSASTFTGNVAVNAGSLTITSDGALGDGSNDIVLGGGTLTASGSLTLGAGRDVSGSGGIRLLTGQTTTLSGNLNATTLEITNDAVGSTAGGSLTLNGTTNTVATLNFSDAVTVNAPNGLSVSTAVNATQTDHTVVINGGINILNTNRPFTIADGPEDVDFDVVGSISNTSATTRLQKLGAGTMRISGANTSLLGGISLSAGRLIIGGNTALGGAQFFFNGGTLQASSPSTFSNTVSFGGATALNAVIAGSDTTFTGAWTFFGGGASAGAKTLTVSNNTTISGNITGTGADAALTIKGNGELILSGPASSFTSLTLDGANTSVVVDGNIGSTPVIITDGTLSGLGTTGNVTANGGTLTVGGVGSFTGTLTIGALALTSAATLTLELGGTAISQYDNITTSGDVTLGNATLDIQLGFAALAGDTFTLINNTGTNPISGTFAGLAEGGIINFAGQEFSISYVGGVGSNDVVLTAIPEPGSALLMLGGLAMLAACRRERRA